jgi:hypothetical protein
MYNIFGDNMDMMQSFQVKKASAEKKIIIGGPLAILSVALFIFGASSDFVMVTALSLFVVSVILVLIGSFQFQKVVKTFKNTVLSEKIKEWITDGFYDPLGGLNPQDVYGCEFLQTADRFHAEDYVRGSIDNVPFEMCDIKLEERRVEHTKNGTRTYYVPYFVGQVYKLGFNKNFKGYLQVLEKYSPQTRRKYKKIKMESVVFNKKFRTHTTDDHTAFYILTPQLMERLLRLEKEHPGNIGVSFIDSFMYLAIHNNKSLLSLRMFQKIDEHTLDGYKNDFNLLNDIIKELKLNKNIFKEV